MGGCRAAFTETCLAVERIHAMGLRVGGNVFVTAANLPQLDQLAATLGRLPIDADMCWETAQFLPTPRSRRNERLRPGLPELLPVAGQILELTARTPRGEVRAGRARAHPQRLPRRYLTHEAALAQADGQPLGDERLLGMLTVPDSLAAQILGKLGVSQHAAEAIVTRRDE